MGISKSIKKRINWLFNVKFDKNTGFYKYQQYKGSIYIRHPRHFQGEENNKWLGENLYYHYYLPKETDTVVELGAGYGEEAVYLHSKSPNINFYGIEIQPVIFECLSNTLHCLGENFKCTSTAVSSEKKISLYSQFSYASVADVPERGYIEIPCISWDNYLKDQNIKSIDLLKMNIEGAERDILSSITDFSIIKRFNISCHDFRANNNEGEYFRTKEDVIKILKQNNYDIKTYDCGYNWSNDWIYAEQKNLKEQ